MPTDGQNLCLSCGLCCDGTLFTRAPVGAAEPVEAFRARGVRITPDRDGKGRYELPLPCLRFENGRCRLLRRVEAGKMGLHEAKGIVQLARERRRRCRRLLDRHFPELAGEPLARALRIVRTFMAGMDESRRRRRFREVHGEFLLAAASLGDCLNSFQPRGSSARPVNGSGDRGMAVGGGPARLAALLLLAGCVLAPDPASAAATSGPAPGPAPPNFLWIVAEDHGPHHGSYADPYASTPNLDRLAAEGARFTRAFATAPICSPARTAIITGMYPTSIGAHHMRTVAVPPPWVKAFPEWLRAAGYFTTNKRKTDYNFSPWLPTDGRRAVLDAPLGVWDQSGRHAHWRNRAPGQPFFSVFNLGATHQGKLRPDRFAKATAGLAPAARHDPAAAPLPPYYPDTPAVRRDVARYYDLVSVMDAGVGALLAELEADGLADDTVVFFYGDHGWGLPRGKYWLYDSGLRVPLLVRWPGRIAPGTVREDPVSFVDFAPTLLALAGAPIPAHLQGRVFLGGDAAPAPEYLFFARDWTTEGSDHIRAVRGRRYKYIRNFAPELPWLQFPPDTYRQPVMQALWRLAAAGALEGAQRHFMAKTKPAEELYDTEADPHEVANLAGDPAHAGRLVRMRTALDRWIESSGDLGATPWAELERRFRPDGVYQKAARPRAHPQGGTFHRPTAVALTCPTEGATIEYTTGLGKAPRWKLYTRPLRMSGSELRELRFRCGRLGYFDSEIVRYYHWWGRAARVPRSMAGDR